MSGQTVTRSQARKSAIVAAAARLFAARGFAAVGVDDIGEAVGVSGPAIYRHFRGKDAILTAVITQAAGTLATAAAAVQGPTGTAAVEELARALTTAALDGPAYLATYQRERHRLKGSDDEAVRALERRVLRIWRVALSRARPEFDLRSLLIRQAAVTGGLSEATTRPSGVPRPRLDELLTRGAVAVALAPRPEVVPAVPATGWTPPTGKRDEILAVALQRLAQRGFHGVGMDEIGEAAGISGPTVYHYFSSKAELLVDAFDRIGERVMAGADEAVQNSRSARDALDRLARSYTVIAADSADLMVVTAREGFAVPGADRPRLARRHRRLRERWGAVVAEVRPDLSEAEIRVLVRMALPLANAAVLADRGRERTDEIATLVVAHLTWS